jgi:arsenite-transporting ATPase
VDELVALAKVVALARSDSYGLHFDRVIIDTAPTGHTLRLLTFPEFLDRFIERLLILRRRFDGAASVLGGASSLLGNVLNRDVGASPTKTGEDEPRAVKALTRFQDQMRDLQTLLKDEECSEFVIVSIPTYLSLTESERLLAALREQGIAVRRGVLNRLIPPDGEEKYIAQLAKGQGACLDELRQLAGRGDVSITEVPFFDAEVRAVYGLRAMGAALFGKQADASANVE